MDPRGGGPCQCVRDFGPSLSERGISLEVVCLDDPDSAYLTGETVPIRALGKGRYSWCYHQALRPWLIQNLRRFDAVILHGLWLYPGHLLSQFGRNSLMPPYYVFPHGMLDPWFQRAPGRRLKAVRNWCYWKLAEQKVIHRAEALFFTSAGEMQLAQNTFHPYHPKRQVIVGLGVSQPPPYKQRMTDAFAQKCQGLRGRPYYLFLSRIDPKKGLDNLIQAYGSIYRQQLKTERPPPYLVIAGPGLETDYGKKMIDLADGTCPPDSVLWPGMLTGDAKWGALYNAEAFVLPSHQENFGIAVVEALTCGTPVLISKQINIWREIQEDNAGLVGDDTLVGAQQLFRRWESLSPKTKAIMKRAAQYCFSNRFEIGRAAQNLTMTIQELTSKSPVRSISL
ncbi:MAG TPA: glycosyltransferase [Verrucomicrobiae bacterium]|jgi:glycosyltransferase involved in cell wall biosynthesis